MANVLDFSNDTEFVLAEQAEQTRQARQWENLDEKTATEELRALNTRVTQLAYDIRNMVQDNKYEETDENCQSVYNYELSAAGWVCSVYNYNISRMPGGWDTMSKPSFYSSLSAEEAKGYNTAVKYLKDLGYLSSASLDLFHLLMKLPLLEGFRIQKLKSNFDEAGFDEALYRRINNETKAVSNQINRNWESIERIAQSAEQFYKNNAGGMSREALNRSYRQARMKDYLADLATSPIYDSLDPRSDGTFTVKAAMLAKLSVIDKYTAKVSQTDDVKSRFEETIKKCKEISAGSLASCFKFCADPDCKNVAAAFETLLNEVQIFAEMSVDTYTAFKDPGSDAPYCFMKKLEAFGSIQGNYTFNPNTFTYDPWSGGTSFKEMYDQAAKAISQHCRDFVYNHGHTNLL